METTHIGTRKSEYIFKICHLKKIENKKKLNVGHSYRKSKYEAFSLQQKLWHYIGLIS